MGRSFHQPGKVNENVLESDFESLCDGTMRRRSLADLRLLEITSDNQGLEVAVRAGLENRGQMSSRQEVNVEHKVSVAAFTSRDERWVGEGREEDTTEERWEGERERRFRLKVTGKGAGGTRVAKCNVNLMKKWSEICSGCTRMLSAVQSRE